MISMIAAVCNNRALGYENNLLVRISEDMKRFKKITLNQTIVMGRKTFESLPGVLPNRTHVVLTRDKNFSVDDKKVFIEHDLFSVIEPYKTVDSPEIFIIGGASIYEQMLPYAHKLYLTVIKADFKADAFFPKIDYSEWGILEKSSEMFDEKNNVKYEFITYTRK